MKIEYTSGSPERRVLVGMIVSDVVLGRVASRWEKGGLLRSEWANLVGEWCVQHYARYKKAPGKDIAAWYEGWAASGADEDTAQLVGKFLASLAGEHVKLGKEINPDLVSDAAATHFNRVKLEKFRDALEGLLERDEVEKAMRLKDALSAVEMGPGEWVDVLRDREGVKSTFAAKQDPIITLDGDVGRFFGQALERDGFIALAAPAKRGKSWWLQEFGWQAMLQGKRVAMFQCGDLSLNQIRMRMYVRAAGRPMHPCGVRMPTLIKRDPDAEGGIEVEYKTREYEAGLKEEEAVAALEKVIDKIKSNKCLFRLSVHANSSISIRGIDETLSRWSREGFDCDVLIIDYADILAPMEGKLESRDQVNMTWKYMRRISQERHCLVLTATQTDANSFSADLIRRHNFSEDNRKHAQVTGMFSVNQTDPEKERGVYRLNWQDLREGEFNETQVVYTAGCLALARPFVKSCF